MSGKGRFKPALSVLMVVAVFAIASSPARHHDDLPSIDEPGHRHSDRSALCLADLPTPHGDCVVCASKRLLSTAMTNSQEGVHGPPPDLGQIADASLGLQMDGRFSLPVRGPPLS